MAYEIEISDLAEADLKPIVLFERRRIVEAMFDQLVHEPGVETRNRKMLDVEAAGFEFEPPLWELRVGEWRVFYDIQAAPQIVSIRAVRFKGRRTTQEIIQ